jgi:AcrR family transcriptional regulator
MAYEVASAVEDPALVSRRRKQIVEAATELFGSTGYFKTSIKDIAKRAGVSPGLVYQYVTDKDDVLLLVLEQVVDAYARELPPAIAKATTPIAKLVAAISAYCRIVDDMRAATVLAYRSTKSLPKHKREVIQKKELATNTMISDVVRECIEGGYIRDVEVDIFTYQIVMTAHGWALKSWYFKTVCTIDEYVRASTDILLRGVLTKRGASEFDA